MTGTRAVLLQWAPSVYRCTLETCRGEITAVRGGRRRAVCCNVHEAGRWARVEYFHPACYDGRHGPVIDRGTLPPKSRTSWTYA
jgi:hypothetical protein